jgi:hypothetical protein
VGRGRGGRRAGPGPARAGQHPRLRLSAHSASSGPSRPASTASARARAVATVRRTSTPCRTGEPLRRCSSSRSAPRRSSRAAPTGLSALQVREADADLGEPLPEQPLGRRRRLPRRLEDVVREERPARPEQVAGEREGLRRGSACSGTGSTGLGGVERHRTAGGVPPADRPHGAARARGPSSAAQTSSGRLLVGEVPDAVEHLQLVGRVDPAPEPCAVRRAAAGRGRRAAAASGTPTPARAGAGSASRSARPRADRPAVPLHRAVGDARHLHRGAAARLGVGVRVARTAPAAQQLAGVRPVVPAAAGLGGAGQLEEGDRRQRPAAARRRSGPPRAAAAGAASTSTARRETTPGCSVATVHASTPPQSWPTTTASRAPRARTIPATSDDSVYGS